MLVLWTICESGYYNERFLNKNIKINKEYEPEKIRSQNSDKMTESE